MLHLAHWRLSTLGRSCLLLLVLCRPSVGLAEEEDSWYVGLGIGRTDFEEASLGGRDDLVILAGGLAVNGVVSFEAAYVDLGGFDDAYHLEGAIFLDQSALCLQASGFTLASIFSWQVTAPFSLGAKLGVSALDIEKQWRGGTLVNPVKANDTGGTETELFYGIRFHYRFHDAWSLGLDWDHYEAGKADIEAIYARVNFHF